MKKTSLRCAGLLLVASLFFSSCQKTDTTSPNSTATENTGVSGRNAGGSTSLNGEPTGDLQISESNFIALMKGDYVEAKVVAPHRYIGTRPIPWPPQPPVNPCDQDWINFAAFMNANRPAMVAWANAHCRPYMGCWSGKCVAIAFFVNPTRICDIAVKYQEHVKVFE